MSWRHFWELERQHQIFRKNKYGDNNNAKCISSPTKICFYSLRKRKPKHRLQLGSQTSGPPEVFVWPAHFLKKDNIFLIKNFTQGQKTFTNGQLKYSMWYFLQTAARRAFLTLNCRDASEPLGAVKSCRGADNLWTWRRFTCKLLQGVPPPKLFYNEERMPRIKTYWDPLV